MRVAVTAGYGRSLHAIALIHELAARGHDVVLVLEVRLFTPARVRFYLRQLGWRKLWQKAATRLFAKHRPDQPPDELAPMHAYVRERQITARSVADACRRAGGRHLRVRGLTTPRALHALRAAAVDLVTYAGGGILRRDFIATPRIGVLNCHGGPLPGFRGMSVAEWALLYGVRPTVSVHFIDTGIDTGPLLLQRPIPLGPRATVAHIRGVATRVSVEALIEAVQLIADGATQTTPQALAAGRQYFLMADPLLEVVQRWLNEGRTPLVDAAEFAYAPAPIFPERRSPR